MSEGENYGFYFLKTHYFETFYTVGVFIRPCSLCSLLVSLSYDNTVSQSLNLNVLFWFIAVEECQQSHETTRPLGYQSFVCLSFWQF